MKKFALSTISFIVSLFCAVGAVASPTKTFTTLFDFDGTNGLQPYSSLVQGIDGQFYGTTEKGGASNSGTVFRITAAGVLTTLHEFCAKEACPDGAYPVTGLTLATNGSLYGTTQNGGVGNAGTIFKITAGGKLTVVYKFCAQSKCSDGYYPSALVQAADGNFYGTTFYGGKNSSGTVFKITAQGALTTLYNFCAQTNCPDGSSPAAALVQAKNGNFYGTTENGGANHFGTVFKITSSGKLTTLHSFNLTDGAGSPSRLVQGKDDNLYGTSELGGANSAGSVFKITPAGSLTTLYSFCTQGYPCPDGAAPLGELVLATDGGLYGTTVNGGTNDVGIVFKVTTDGKVTKHTFDTNGGHYPYAGLLQATTGDLIGTTYLGGTHSDGTIYALSIGQQPFVKTEPASGQEGLRIDILGQDFTGSSVVKFGGVQAAKVKLNGTTELIATVPVGALTGPLTVRTGTARLTSNQPFRVTPQLLHFSPSQGPVGQSVTITGVGLLQTLRVEFGDDVPGTNLKVMSDRKVTVEVPTNARTGRIRIRTKGGTSLSTTVFTVTR